MTRSRSDPKQDLGLYLDALGFEREVRFHETRRWRFDFARGDIAVEYEGGVFGEAGGHRATGKFLRDLEKYSMAAAMGWKVIRVTAREVESGQAFDWIEAAMKETT